MPGSGRIKWTGVRLGPSSFAAAFALLVLALLTRAKPVRAQRAAESRAGAAPVTREPAGKFELDSRVVTRLFALQAERRALRDREWRDPEAWAQNRGKRADQHREKLGAIWGGVVDSPDALAALRIHADRMARLNRILDLAVGAPDVTLAKRAQADIDTELLHHAARMQKLGAGTGP